MNAAGRQLALGASGSGGAPGFDASERSFWIGLIVVLLALVSALATYLILTGLTPIVPRNDVVLIVLLINVVLIVAMIAVIAWQVAGLWRAWRDKEAGARLHVRIVALFSIIAALPAILLAVAATTTFARSLDGWFSTRARAIIDNSLDVAKAYLDEHGQVIRTDIVNMARDLDSAADLVQGSEAELEQLLVAQAGLRELPFAVILDAQGEVKVRATSERPRAVKPPPDLVIAQAEAGAVPVLTPSDGYRIAALAKLQRYPGRYLYVARDVSPKVLGHLRRTEQNVDEYNRLRQARGGLKLAHGLMYTMISMTALLAAIWTGMWFAGRFVAPIRRLIGAAQEVSAGNLQVQLPEKRGEGDLRRLSGTFNVMTRELKSQRDALVTANEQLTERRRFMEAVLSGVSAGVIGLDSHGRVELASRSAQLLLGLDESQLVGKRLIEAVPAFAAVLEAQEARSLKARPQAQVTLAVGSEERTFAVRVTQEKAGAGDVGSVVTFDDITELVSAQRSSAWGDVARRIAHEIKNPLTPIQLSAERLKRKYGPAIVDDRETFDKLTDTIVRQVGDLKTMVDEFAAFARMPTPVMETTDLRDAVQEPVILFREGHPRVTYTLELPDAPVIGSFDRRLVSQAVTNLVKNATEAVEAADADPSMPGWAPRVETRMVLGADRVAIEVIDNGVGLPKQNRYRLLEPYVTTKGHKGTGLGLAMVQKITEQHGGTLVLDDADKIAGHGRGAVVRMTLPYASGGTPAARPDAETPVVEKRAATNSRA